MDMTDEQTAERQASRQTAEQQTSEQVQQAAGPGAERAPGPDDAAGSVSASGAEAPSPPEGEVTEPGDAQREQAALQIDVEELMKAAAKRDEYLALAQRTQADFENYRKRVAKETALAGRRGVAKLARELLPALDNLDRAIEAAEEGDPLLEGVRLVRNELHGALTRVGIESFSPHGERFDPAEHEAMAQQPVDGAQSGHVAEVYQPGYRMAGEVIRPARVLVAA